MWTFSYVRTLNKFQEQQKKKYQQTFTRFMHAHSVHTKKRTKITVLCDHHHHVGWKYNPYPI